MSDRLNYNTLAPAAMKALGGVHVYLHSQADLPKNLIDLAYLRTSQINGCAYCNYGDSAFNCRSAGADSLRDLDFPN